MEVKVLGKVLGECSGWEEIDLLVLQFIDVTFNEEFQKIFGAEANSVVVNYDDGNLQVYNFENDGSTEYYKEFKITGFGFATDGKHHSVEGSEEDVKDDNEEDTPNDSDDEADTEIASDIGDGRHWHFD